MNYSKQTLIYLVFFFIYFFLVKVCLSQPNTEWVSRFNSGPNKNDHVTDMITDSFGNIYLCGYRGEGFNADEDALLLKYNSSGNLLWSRTWRGTNKNNLSNKATKILFDNEGFIYLLGWASMDSNVVDFLLVKYNPDGDTLWVRTYDGMNDELDDARGMAIDINNNIYISGLLYRFGNVDNGTIKYDKNGNLKWVRKFSEFGGGDVLLDSEFVYVGGGSQGNITILKYDTLGIPVDTFYCETSNSDAAEFMVFDNQKNLITSGLENAGLPTSLNIVTAKFSQTGEKSWVSIFNNNFDNIPEYVYSLKTDTLGNVLIFVRSRTQQDQRAEFALIKYNNITGDSIWTRKYNLVPFSNEQPSSMTIDKSNNIYLLGDSDSSVIFSRMLLVKYDPAGVLQWHKVYYPSTFSNSFGNCITTDRNGNIYVAGYTTYAETGDDIILIKYSQMTNVIQSNLNVPERFELYQNYPNPFNSQTEIKFDLTKAGLYSLEIFDVVGRNVETIFKESKTAGSYKVSYDASNLPSGLYFYKLSSSEISLNKKFVLIK